MPEPHLRRGPVGLAALQVSSRSRNSATRAQLEALRANLARTEACLDDPAALAAVDLEFHELVVRASGNRVMVMAGTQDIKQQIEFMSDVLGMELVALY